MFGRLFRRRDDDTTDGVGAGRVSVVVPLYNHARYIEAAIDSALAQGDVLRELVVIDDGSTDDSAKVMQRLAARDARIRFRSQANQGSSATINAGLRDCTGEFVAILNSDDAYLPGRLAALARALDAAPSAGIAASGIAFMDGQGRPVANAWYEEALAFRAGHGVGTALVNGNFLMTTSNFLFRRDLLDAVGEFAALRYTQDLDFALRALALGHGIVRLDETLLRYRIHAHNTIAEDHRKVRAEWAAAAAAYLTLLWDRPGAAEPDWDDAAAMEQVLQRHELSRAVHLCMAYLRRHCPDPQALGRLDRAPFLRDEAFRARLAGWA
jgi:glycosyltransferase involved in cell wall biosynthesis